MSLSSFNGPICSMASGNKSEFEKDEPKVGDMGSLTPEGVVMESGKSVPMEKVKLISLQSLGDADGIVMDDGTILTKEKLLESTQQFNHLQAMLETPQTYECSVTYPALNKHTPDLSGDDGFLAKKLIISKADKAYKVQREKRKKTPERFQLEELIFTEETKMVLFDRLFADYKTAVAANATTIKLRQGCCPHFDRCTMVQYMRCLLHKIHLYIGEENNS